MGADFAFEVSQFFEYLRVIQRELTKFHECLHDKDADFDGARRVENASRHDRAVFGERTRWHARVPETAKVVTMGCYLHFLFLGEKEHERGRKTASCSF